MVVAADVLARPVTLRMASEMQCVALEAPALRQRTFEERAD